MNSRRRLKTNLGGIFLLAAAVCLATAASPASPAANKIDDHGTFVLELGGHEYGTEKFNIESAKKQVTVESESRLRQGGTGRLVRTSSKLVLDGSLKPQTYSWSVRGPEKLDLLVDFTSSPAKSHLHRADGKDDLREIELPNNILILDNNVIVHYQLLIDLFVRAGGGKQTFQAYIPQSAVPGTLSVQDAGMENLSIGNTPHPLRHLVVISDNAQIDLWVDGSNRLQRLYWGVPQIEALRQP